MPLSIEKITPFLNNKTHSLCILDTVDSTNTYLKQHPNHDICLSESQKSGRGRFDRTWHSPHGENIYFSMRYCFPKKIHQLYGLSLTTGLATLKAIEQTLHADTLKLKWPNDLMFSGQKCGGILIDIEKTTKQATSVIIGIGINVNMTESKENIDQPWTSLKKITGKTIDRNNIIVSLINTLNHYYDTFSTHGFSAFKKEWAEKDALFHQPIQILSEGHIIKGTMIGVDDHGSLLLKEKEGKIHTCSSGEITIPILSLNQGKN